MKTSYTALGSPWENGYNESFTGRLRNELLNCESFCTLKEARFLWRAGVGITTTFVRTVRWGFHRRRWRRPLSLLIPLRFMTRDRMEETTSPQRTITYLGVDHDSRNAQLLNFVYEEISQTPNANSSVSRSFLNFLEAKKHSSNKRLGLKSTVCRKYGWMGLQAPLGSNSP